MRHQKTVTLKNGVTKEVSVQKGNGVSVIYKTPNGKYYQKGVYINSAGQKVQYKETYYYNPNGEPVITHEKVKTTRIHHH